MLGRQTRFGRVPTWSVVIVVREWNSLGAFLFNSLEAFFNG